MAFEIENSVAPNGIGYGRPTVEDYGSLQAITADFDLDFVGSVAKVVTLAVASMPVWDGGHSTAGSAAVDTPTDMGNGPGTSFPADGGPPESGSGPLDVSESGTLSERQSGGGVGDGNLHLGDVDQRAGGSALGGGVREEVAGAGGLPFTGYAGWAAAAIGAAMTTSGVILRDVLRRRQ
jgi:hypothetical protein